MSEAKNGGRSAQPEGPGPNDYRPELRYRLHLSGRDHVHLTGALQLKVRRLEDGRVLFCLPKDGVETWTMMSKRDQWFAGFDPASLEALDPDIEYGASLPMVLAPVLDAGLERLQEA